MRSSTSAEGAPPRPCSSQVYQVGPMLARCATSSRRSPTVRRRFGGKSESGRVELGAAASQVRPKLVLAWDGFVHPVSHYPMIVSRLYQNTPDTQMCLQETGRLAPGATTGSQKDEIMARYRDKKVVVIGGTSGMGLATARHLSEQGASVLVTGRTETDIQTARAMLGDRAVVRSDVGSMADIRALPSIIREHLGSIDLLFVNAGINVGAPFGAIAEDVYGQAFRVNTKGPYFTVQTLAPLINDGGAIVFTTSVANVRGLPGASVYAATKAAVRSMVRSFAGELLDRNIRVNAVSPGPIDTPILAKSLGEEAAEQARAMFRQKNPMKRFGTSEEIARAVAFLGFEATYTTGAELPVDGGASQL